MHVFAHISGPEARAIGIAVTLLLIAAVIIGVFLAWFIIWAILRIVRSSRKRPDDN
jgi:hypothetical protein